MSESDVREWVRARRRDWHYKNWDDNPPKELVVSQELYQALLESGPKRTSNCAAIIGGRLVFCSIPIVIEQPVEAGG